LIRGFDRELVSSVGKALIMEVQTLEVQDQLGVGFGSLLRIDGTAITSDSAHWGAGDALKGVVAAGSIRISHQ